MEKRKRAKTSETATMRAVRVSHFGGPQVLRLETNVPVPTPTPSQVLVEVKAAGINPVDIYIRTGSFFEQPSLPYTPGCDVAGLVKAVGEKVTKFKVDDRVFVIRTSSGGYAEYATAEESMVGHLSDSLTFQQGAAVGIPYFTAFRALCLLGREKMKPNNVALIHGASGAVGIACVQIAASRGLKVYGTAGSLEGLDLVVKQGATAAFSHKEKGYVNKILEATDERRPDLIVEMLAGANLDADLDIINERGIIVIVGGSKTIEVDPGLFMGKQSQVVRMSLLKSTEDEWTEMHSLVSEAMRKGWLQPHICKEYKLEEAKVAHQELASNTGAQGKRVFVM